MEAYYRDKALREKLQNMPKFINKGQQNKHIQGTNEFLQYEKKLSKNNKFGPSFLEIDEKTILELVNKYAGTGVLKRGGSGNLIGETITTNDIHVGIAVNDITGYKIETTVFGIKYSDKNGIHIYPDYPSKKGAKQTK